MGSASTAQRLNKQVETNKSNQRPPKISEAEQHHQRPQQPQQQHVRFSATSVSASVVTKFRHLRTPHSSVGKGPKTLSIQEPREIQKLRTCSIPIFAESVRMQKPSCPARPRSKFAQTQDKSYLCTQRRMYRKSVNLIGESEKANGA